MTPLEKRVQRRCVASRDAGRRLVVALEPADDEGNKEHIRIRCERTRKWFMVPVLDVYHLGVKRELGLKQAARRNRRRGRV